MEVGGRRSVSGRLAAAGWSVERDVTNTAGGERRYPDHPIVGVGAVVLVDGKIVLVKRAHEPLQGKWNLPGGGVELGETLRDACAREVLEETGLVVDVGPVIEVFDRIMMDADGGVQYHFVLVDYVCRPAGGSLRCGSDASDIALADPDALDEYQLTGTAIEVIRKALDLPPESGSHR
jgi:ADP-ribose pyrophosphatase YjhB (NUDIX family)